ncbi:hypothetical protein PTKIN_Ptkin15bG0120300 [Pterospermum kingtungense]
MSCLSLRIHPAKKAWKSFTSKLLTRLHKLHKSRAIKKPKSNRLQTAASKTTRRSLFLGQRLRRRSKRRRALPLGYQRYYVSNDKAHAAPVYIDKLFKEAPVAVTELVGCIHRPPSSEKSNIVALREENVKLSDEVSAAGTSMEVGERQGDDMWENIGLASPMMHGIDARAEEFIASFRAEMERQEIIARNL